MVLPVVVCYITSSHGAANQFRGTVALALRPVGVSVHAHTCTDFVSQLVAQATTSGEGDLLNVALILARQAALEGAHVHPPYQKWFQVSATFGGSNTHTHTHCLSQCCAQEHFSVRRPTRKVLHFVVRHLTSLLPFEPACCLKVCSLCLSLCINVSYIVGTHSFAAKALHSSRCC